MNILFHGKGGIVGNSSSILFELLAFCIHASYDAVDADAAIQIVVERGISRISKLKKRKKLFSNRISWYPKQILTIQALRKEASGAFSINARKIQNTFNCKWRNL